MNLLAFVLVCNLHTKPDSKGKWLCVILQHPVFHHIQFKLLASNSWFLFLWCCRFNATEIHSTLVIFTAKFSDSFSTYLSICSFNVTLIHRHMYNSRIIMSSYKSTNRDAVLLCIVMKWMRASECPLGVSLHNPE